MRWCWFYQADFGKTIWIYIICAYGKWTEERRTWGWGQLNSVSEGRVAISCPDKCYIPHFFFFFFLLFLVCTEFLISEPWSNTLSLKLFKLLKPPLHNTPSCCHKGKPQHSVQDRWTIRCPDWDEPWFPPLSALQKSRGYQQYTTVLVDALEILREYSLKAQLINVNTYYQKRKKKE